MPTPELLAPAGSLRMAETALAYGANAIYAGQPRYSLRVRNNEFGQIENLATGIALVQGRGGKFYVVSNIYPHNAKLKTYLADMAPVVALKPDALIMADPGLMLMIRETWPEMPIHLSVQANTVNYAAVRFWRSIGVARIILSRELSLDEMPRFATPVRTSARSVHPRRPVRRPFRPLPALGLLQSPRPEPGQLHQLLPLELCRQTCGGESDRRCLSDRRADPARPVDAHRGRPARQLHPQF
jgi:hypothetical protein